MASGDRLGEVTHYFDRIGVAVIRLSQPMKVGDSVHFFGRRTDFRQEIGSMQIEHQDVTEVDAGAEVAVKVSQRVRRGDSVFRLSGEG